MNVLEVRPIGLVRSPFKDKRSAPRQPHVARGVDGRIELFPDSRYQYALADLEGWSHIWLVFWFHLNAGWRPKVRPPRSLEKRGVFSTRSPHRPNPIGLSLLRLVRIEGTVLHVLDLDVVDGSPVIDIKPYVAYADTAAGAHQGWLAASPDVPRDAGPTYMVEWTRGALERTLWLQQAHDVTLREAAERALSMGPTPHPYRRIKQHGDHLVMGLRDWRLRFRVDDRIVTVHDVKSGYRPRVLNDPHAVANGETPLSVHREFVARFG